MTKIKPLGCPVWPFYINNYYKCFEDGGRRVSHLTTGLREQCADWSVHILETWNVCYRCSTLRLVWSTDSMSLMLWCRCIGCASHSVSNSIWRSWSIELFIHGNAPDYLKPFTWLSDVPSRSSLCSASSHHLLNLPVRRLTVGARAFPVSGYALWNSLPANFTSVNSLSVFRRRLINYLFLHSYPGTFQ